MFFFFCNGSELEGKKMRFATTHMAGCCKEVALMFNGQWNAWSQVSALSWLQWSSLLQSFPEVPKDGVKAVLRNSGSSSLQDSKAKDIISVYHMKYWKYEHQATVCSKNEVTMETINTNCTISLLRTQ